MKEIFKIIYFTIIFTVVIFFINYSFFWNTKNNIQNNIIEEEYIEEEKKSAPELKDKTNNKQLISFYKNKIDVKYNFYYYPLNFKQEINELKDEIENIIIENIFLEKIDKLNISLIKEKLDRRWKIKNKEIKLYWATNQNINEYISVFIHEFWHYIDLYFLEKKVFLDISSKFYEISWLETKIKKQNMEISDFVSWYAATNKYEDFAESFTYYVLHNKDFLEKAKTNQTIKTKYDFFWRYIFKNKEFFSTKFNDEKIKNYYWDVTKINFDEKKLFNYLEKIKSPLY